MKKFFMFLAVLGFFSMSTISCGGEEKAEDATEETTDAEGDHDHAEGEEEHAH